MSDRRTPSTYERVVAMNVTDEAEYARYREGMTPILAEYGGSFRCDCVVARTLQSELPHDVTRVFVMAFPDRASSDAFFQDARYLAVRAKHFDAAVAGFTVLATSERG